MTITAGHQTHPTYPSILSSSTTWSGIVHAARGRPEYLHSRRRRRRCQPQPIQGQEFPGRRGWRPGLAGTCMHACMANNLIIRRDRGAVHSRNQRVNARDAHPTTSSEQTRGAWRGRQGFLVLDQGHDHALTRWTATRTGTDTVHAWQRCRQAAGGLEEYTTLH